MKDSFNADIDLVREPLGVIILEGCTVELAEEETDVFAFKVKFVLEMIMMI